MHFLGRCEEWLRGIVAKFGNMNATRKKVEIEVMINQSFPGNLKERNVIPTGRSQPLFYCLYVVIERILNFNDLSGETTLTDSRF